MNDKEKKYDKTKSTFTSILPRPELMVWLLHLKVGSSWLNIANLQGESKKSGISKNKAITALKSIRKGKSWCVLENSA